MYHQCCVAFSIHHTHLIEVNGRKSLKEIFLKYIHIVALLYSFLQVIFVIGLSLNIRNEETQTPNEWHGK